MNYTIDINCDLGEGIGNDSLIMPLISSCNIACGGHAGDEKSIRDSVKLALKHQVKIGAHPSYPDPLNFGRKKMDIPLAELQKNIEDQVNRMSRIVNDLGGVLHHIKTHGALYNEAAKDKDIAQTIINAVKNTSRKVFLYVPYQSVIEKLARESDIPVKREAFADRNYNRDRSLVSRTFDHASIKDPVQVKGHLVNMIRNKKVKCIDGVEVAMVADTFCIHGDNPEAVKILNFLHRELPTSGIKVE